MHDSEVCELCRRIGRGCAHLQMRPVCGAPSTFLTGLLSFVHEMGPSPTSDEPRSFKRSRSCASAHASPSCCANRAIADSGMRSLKQDTRKSCTRERSYRLRESKARAESRRQEATVLTIKWPAFTTPRLSAVHDCEDS